MTSNSQQQQQQQWVSVSTIYGNLIRVPVHPGMTILDFKDKCFTADLWYGSPICVCTPLAINVDVAAMMSEGEPVIDPRPWQMSGKYNRFRLRTKDGTLLNDEGVLQEDMLTDSTLFKVQWMKQFNFRVEETAMVHECLTSMQPVESIAITFNHNASFLAFPFYRNEEDLLGLVYQHNDTRGHCEVPEVAQVSFIGADRTKNESKAIVDFPVMPGNAQSQ